MKKCLAKNFNSENVINCENIITLYTSRGSIPELAEKKWTLSPNTSISQLNSVLVNGKLALKKCAFSPDLFTGILQEYQTLLNGKLAEKKCIFFPDLSKLTWRKCRFFLARFHFTVVLILLYLIFSGEKFDFLFPRFHFTVVLILLY